ALPSAVAIAQRQGAHAAVPSAAPAAPAALAAPAPAGATAKRQGAAQPSQQLANAGAIAQQPVDH
ncbi:hypothetical protein QZM22_11055, partial [Burkholderia oklahomensis]